MNPQIVKLLKTHPKFAELEKKMVSAMIGAQNLDEAFKRFKEFGALLSDWKFIFPMDNQRPGILAKANFSHGAVIRSLFATTHVHVWDKETMAEILETGAAKLPLDYSIALDSQALSYLVPFLNGKTNSTIPDDFLEVFNFIVQDYVNVDPLPYYLENTPRMGNIEHIHAVYKSLLAYERLRNIDAHHLNTTGIVRSKLSEEQLATNAQQQVASMIEDYRNPAILSTVQFRYNTVYALLLKIVTIQINSPKQGIKKKLNTLLNFMDETLGMLAQRELLLASHYFQQGQDFSFFNTIQRKRNGKEMLANLSSMTWDLLHLRLLDEAMTKKSTDEARYFFPAILTFDKRYADLMDVFPLKGFAYNELTGHKYAYYGISNFGENSEAFEAEFIDKYFSENALTRRASSCKKSKKQIIQNVAALIDKLETEFLKVTEAS